MPRWLSGARAPRRGGTRLRQRTAAETYWQDFHQRQVGATGAAFAHLPARPASATYAASSAALTSPMPAVDAPLGVPDLACGDGYLVDLLPSLRFGDRRTGSESGWRALLDGAFTHVELDDIDLPWSPTPQEPWTALPDTYDIDGLHAAARQRLRDALMAAVAPPQVEDGTIAAGRGLRLARAHPARDADLQPGRHRPPPSTV